MNPATLQHPRLETATPRPGVVEVSVCIANWNCREHLRACLRSLAQPQGVRLEVIVVDNASTDGAAELVAREFPDVVLIRNAANRGFAAANNQAAEVARGRYLFFLNNDTIMPAEGLGELVKFAEAHPEAGIIGPRLRDADGAVQASARAMPSLATFLRRTLLGRWLGRRAYRHYRRATHIADRPREVELLMGAAMLIRRDLLTAAGGWCERYIFGGEDMDLCRRIGQSHRLVYYPDVEVTHLGRVSTRLNLDLTAVQIPIGYVRFFRDSGCSRRALLAYKAIISLDAILQCVVKGLQYLARRLRGHRQADKSLEVVRQHGRFLTHGLVSFWKA